MGNYIIEIQDVHKSFKVGDQTLEILKGNTINVDYGDFVILFGASGSGKSTLLHIILGLEPPSSGKIFFLGDDLYKEGTNEDYRSEFRKRHIGMIYQQPNWIKSLSVIENVSFPLLLLGMDKARAYQKGLEALKVVNMENWKGYIPTELSSGQQQRVALARGIINNPQIIIADEPTGNLDQESGQKLMQILKDLNDKSGKTVLMVTHDLEYLTFAKTAFRMVDGIIVGVYRGAEKEKLFGELKFKRGVIDDKNNTGKVQTKATIEIKSEKKEEVAPAKVE